MEIFMNATQTLEAAITNRHALNARNASDFKRRVKMEIVYPLVRRMNTQLGGAFILSQERGEFHPIFAAVAEFGIRATEIGGQRERNDGSQPILLIRATKHNDTSVRSENDHFSVALTVDQPLKGCSVIGNGKPYNTGSRETVDTALKDIIAAKINGTLHL
jgi:hypothetical protein